MLISARILVLAVGALGIACVGMTLLLVSAH
jgi:hypothetical protein